MEVGTRVSKSRFRYQYKFLRLSSREHPSSPMRLSDMQHQTEDCRPYTSPSSFDEAFGCPHGPQYPTFPTKLFSAMRRFTPLLLIAVMVTAAPATGQHHDSPGANFDLAARWAPYRINDIIYSTSVRPQWIEDTENFWYEWKSSEGTFYYIVDSNR